MRPSFIPGVLLFLLVFSVPYVSSEEAPKTGELKILSPVFENDGYLPLRYTCDGKNINPPLMVENVPQEAKSLALILDDLDAPRGTFVHWIVWNIDPRIKVGDDTKELSKEEITALMDWVGEIGKGFCRNCGYCLPCPERIATPDIFRFEGYYERYDLKSWAIEQYRALPTKANACSSCNQCLARCPYCVSIPEQLEKIHQRLGV